MEIFNIHAAKTNLSKLVEQAIHGQEVIIGRNGTPVAKLVPYMEPVQSMKPREFGQWTGKVWYAPDYDEADALIQKMFEDELEHDWKD